MSNYTPVGHFNIIEDGQVIGTRTYDVHHDPAGPIPYYVICDLCGSKMGTTVNGSLTSFMQHRGSAKCGVAKRRAERVRKKEEKEEAERQRKLALNPPMTPHRNFNPGTIDPTLHPPPTPLRPRASTLSTVPLPNQNRFSVPTFGAHSRDISVYDSESIENSAELLPE